MCSGGMNSMQYEQMIDQIDDHIALEYRWLHKIAHMAADANLESTSAKLHEAQSLLADVRACLDEAKNTLEANGRAMPTNNVTAHLV